MPESSAPALRRRFLLATAAFMLLDGAGGSAFADRLRLEALVEEGDLLLEEAATLSPSDAQLSEEGQRLLASEKALREEVRTLNQQITQFNAAMAEQNKAVQAAQAQCPSQTNDQALAESCDKRFAQLHDQGNLLEDERLQLRAHQEQLNARVDQQDAWARDYGKRKGAQDSRDKLNRGDSEEWLTRAKQFLASDDFKELLARAGNPPVCANDAVGQGASPGARPALERVQTCLRAVKAGNR